MTPSPPSPSGARLRSLMIETWDSWRTHRTLRVGAGLAYYTLFGIVPFLSLSVFLANLAFSTAEIRARLDEALTSLLGTEQAEGLAASLGEVMGDPAVGSSTGVVGIVSLVLASGLVLAALQDAMDIIFEAPVERTVTGTLRRRLFLFALVVVLSSAILLALVFESIVGGLIRFLTLDRLAPDLAGLILSTRVVSLALIVVAATLLYRLLPRTQPPWRTALLGAAIATAIGALATVGVSYYLSTLGSTSIQGAAGGIVLVLTLVFAWCQVLLAGAELVRQISLDSADPEPDIVPPPDPQEDLP
jgi:membrane protein